MSCQYREANKKQRAGKLVCSRVRWVSTEEKHHNTEDWININVCVDIYLISSSRLFFASTSHRGETWRILGIARRIQRKDWEIPLLQNWSDRGRLNGGFFRPHDFDTFSQAFDDSPRKSPIERAILLSRQMSCDLIASLIDINRL